MTGQDQTFAYDGLDRTIHERARLSIMTSLMAHPGGLAFGELKALCGLTDGNLSRHLKVLEEAGYVGIDKAFRGKKPSTTCAVTEEGRRAFARYLSVLEQVVRDASDAAAVADPRLRPT